MSGSPASGFAPGLRILPTMGVDLGAKRPSYRFSKPVPRGWLHRQQLPNRPIPSGLVRSVRPGRQCPDQRMGVREDPHCPSTQSSAWSAVMGCHHSSPGGASRSCWAIPSGKPALWARTSSATGFPCRAITTLSPSSTSWRSRESWVLASWMLTCTSLRLVYFSSS